MVTLSYMNCDSIKSKEWKQCVCVHVCTCDFFD